MPNKLLLGLLLSIFCLPNSRAQGSFAPIGAHCRQAFIF